MGNQTIYPYGQDGLLPSGYPIADDLNTDSAQQALSARQGVVLRDLIETTEKDYHIQYWKYSSIDNYIALSTNLWDSSNKTTSFFIPITPGVKYVVTAGSSTARIAILTTNVVTVGETPSYALGESALRLIEAGTKYEFIAPADAAYININRLLSSTDITPNKFVEIVENAATPDKLDTISDDLDTLRGDFDEQVDFDELEVMSTSASRISIEKDANGGIVVNNVASQTGYYALIKLPESLEAGVKYKLSFRYSSVFFKNSAWWLAFVDSEYSATSGGVEILQQQDNRYTELNFTHDANNIYLRFASTSQNTGAWVYITDFSISNDKTSVAELSERISNLEENADTSRMDNLIAQARFIGNSPTVSALALLHFTDIHGDSVAAADILRFYNRYSTKIDDMVQTGDAVYYYWNSANQGYQWFQNNGLANSLFVLGNHDGCANDNSKGWKEGTADWDFKGKEWDFDTYFANYISSRGVTPPTGYDDSTSPYYKACYWHKDYASAKIRVIGLDCMHFNDGVRYTSDDQETWLAAKLQETLTSGNDAYGYSVVFLCHYPIDDYSGNNETWDDSSHRFTFNKNSNGGHVMDANTQRPVNCHYGDSFTAEAKFSMRNRVGTVGSPSYTKGTNNPIGEVIKSWMDAGGKYIVWLSGHTHTEYMYYPEKYPDMLVLGLPQAGSTRGSIVADRANDSAMHACANLVVFDTQHSQIKIIRFGKTLDRMLMKFETLCYNYGSTDRSVGR